MIVLRFLFGGDVKNTVLLLIASLALLSGCGGSGGGSNSSGSAQNASPLSGNWQFTMAAPPDNSSIGGLQGGFLLQKSGAVSGGVTYSIMLPGQQGGSSTLCNGGSAPMTGTLSGQAVTLTAIAGSQTFALTGTLSGNGTTMSGTYNSTDGSGCGTTQNGLQWSAVSIPPLTGSVLGSFHSVLSTLNPSLNASLRDQDFPVTGTLTQGSNIGASNATVTGTLNFQGYPCLVTASVNGQVSGSSVILQIISPSGQTVGQIGAPSGRSNPSAVTFQSAVGGSGAVLQGANGYGVTTPSCPGGILDGDIGNVCLALGNATTCTEPILITPASLSFPTQALGSAATTQTITLTNNATSGATLSGLSLSFNPQSGAPSPFGLSDFNGLPNFSSQDTCANPSGSSFDLAPQQSCSITVSFSPQQACPWLPSAAQGGVSPGLCPFPLSATLTVNSPTSADGDPAFAVPITGTGLSALIPSTPELDFGAVALSEMSAPQSLSFTNQSAGAVQILPALSAPCTDPSVGVLTLPRPPVAGVIAGLQVDTGSVIPNGATINYLCDSDLTSKLANFQISADTCSGQLLTSLQSCSLQVTYVPQPSTALIPALDYFLELNTLECSGSTTSECEIDSGRFPVELTANVPSPLRMVPGAGLDFGAQAKGQLSLPLTITLFNDPSDPMAGAVNSTGNLVKGDYFETDNCGTTLPSGASCTLTITFKPKIIGFDPGTIIVTYNNGQTQTIHLRGTGQ